MSTTTNVIDNNDQQNKKNTISVNLITYNNSYGLTQDVRLLKEALETLYSKNNVSEVDMTFKFVNFYELL